MDIQEVFTSIGFDPRMAIFTTINFLVIYVILRKYLFKKIGTIVSERQKRIQESLENAERLEKALGEAEATADRIIKDANKKANEIIKKHQEEAEVIVTEAKQKAQEESEKILKETRDTLSRERKEMIQKLIEDISDLAVEGAEKIIEEKLDEETDKKVITSYLEQLEVKDQM